MGEPNKSVISSQDIKQQLTELSMEDFEDLLETAAAKDNPAIFKNSELLVQLKDEAKKERDQALKTGSATTSVPLICLKSVDRDLNEDVNDVSSTPTDPKNVKPRRKKGRASRVEEPKIKTMKKAHRETVYKTEDLPGHKGNQNIEETIEFILGESQPEKKGKGKRTTGINRKENEKQPQPHSPTKDESFVEMERPENDLTLIVNGGTLPTPSQPVVFKPLTSPLKKTEGEEIAQVVNLNESEPDEPFVLVQSRAKKEIKQFKRQRLQTYAAPSPPRRDVPTRKTTSEPRLIVVNSSSAPSECLSEGSSCELSLSYAKVASMSKSAAVRKSSQVKVSRPTSLPLIVPQSSTRKQAATTKTGTEPEKNESLRQAIEALALKFQALEELVHSLVLGKAQEEAGQKDAGRKKHLKDKGNQTSLLRPRKEVTLGCSHQPVIFCGTQFESSQSQPPPVENIGVEFGCGDMEAWKDERSAGVLTEGTLANSADRKPGGRKGDGDDSEIAHGLG